MGKLEDVEKELYSSDEDKLNQRMHRRFVLPESLDQPPPSWTPQEKKIEEPLMNKRLLKILLGALGMVLAAGLAAFLFLYLSNKGKEAEIKIEGRDKVESGEIVSIPFYFKNISSSKLKDVELSIVFPEGTRVIDEEGERVAPPRLVKKISDLNPGEEKTTEVSTRLFGKEGEEKTVQAILLYQPESLKARFSASTSKVLTISHVSLAISWETPSLVSNGQDVQIKIRYISDAQLPFEDISFRMEYPPGFSFKSAEPKPDIGDTLWKIGTISPGKDGTIILIGKISGEQGEKKIFKGSLGFFDMVIKELKIYSESTQEVKIAPNPLSIKGFAPGGGREYVISAKENLTFNLHYKNNTDVALKNVFVHAFLESGSAVPGKEIGDFLPDSGRNLVDMNTLSMQNNGVYDSSTKSIVWGPSSTEDLQELKPGGEGDLFFSVRTRDSFPIRSESDRNLVLRIRSVIDAADVPQEFSGTKVSFEDRLDLKSKSKVLFSAKSLYHASTISNFGPLPPKVGAKTTYTVLWDIRNFSNDLQGVEIKATLPPNVIWENTVVPSTAGINYERSSGEVKWVVGSVSSGTGVLNPALTAVFQVSVIPSESDIGHAMVLLNQSVFTGTDTFTKESVNLSAGGLTTELKEDTSTTLKDWTVIK